MVRLATLADIEHVFTKLQSVPAGAPSAAVISASDLELAAELLGYSLSSEELIDCVRFCTGSSPRVEKSGTDGDTVVLNYTDKITMHSFAAWWNSDRCNPNLRQWKSTHTAQAHKIEGSGTVFG